MRILLIAAFCLLAGMLSYSAVASNQAPPLQARVSRLERLVKQLRVDVITAQQQANQAEQGVQAVYDSIDTLNYRLDKLEQLEQTTP